MLAKIQSRLLPVLVACAVAFAGLGLAGALEAASPDKAYAAGSSAKKMSMVKKKTAYKGQTIQLKVKKASDKITWKSSNKKVASVNSSGQVRALKAGKATISAKVGGKTFKCKVTVKTPSKAKREALAKKVAKRVVKKYIKPGMNQAEKAYALLSYVCATSTSQTNQSDKAYQSNYGNEAYACLVMGKAACSGYCKAYIMLCKQAGLSAKHVNANQWTHQWTKVKVKGKWYVVDPQAGYYTFPQKLLRESTLRAWDFGVCTDCGYKYYTQEEFAAHCEQTGCPGSSHVLGWCNPQTWKLCKTCSSHINGLTATRVF